MSSVLRNFIEIVGIADPASFPTAPTMFAQLTVTENLVIPDAKPDIEQITQILIEANITSTSLIETPVGTSLEGQILTGAKLIVEGVVRQKILYVADAPDQPLHAAEFEVPFSTFIVMPPTIGTIPIIDLLPSIKVTPFIEDVFVEQTSPRSIVKNVVLFLNATVSV